MYRGIIHKAGDVRAESSAPTTNVVEDCLTHKRYDVEPFEMPGLDEIRRDKMPEGVRIREEADEMKKQMVLGNLRAFTKLPPLRPRQGKNIPPGGEGEDSSAPRTRRHGRWRMFRRGYLSHHTRCDEGVRK